MDPEIANKIKILEIAKVSAVDAERFDDAKEIRTA
jgi:hypothetical protein